MIRAARRPTTALLLVLAGASPACNTWRVQSVAPEELWRAGSPPSTVRVRLQDSTLLVLERPYLANDSMTGTRKGAPATVSLSDVTEVAVRKFSPKRTAGLALGVVGLFTVAALAACASGGCAPNFQGFSLGY
jgi:hypothetical protein